MKNRGAPKPARRRGAYRISEEACKEEVSVEYVEPNIVKLSNSDFELEEPWQDIRGFDVYDIKGEQIGTVAKKVAKGAVKGAAKELSK